MKKALILGISGQDGAYLAHFLYHKGYAVHGSSRDPSTTAFAGLERIGLRGRVAIHQAALTNPASVRALMLTVRPDEIYHLAGQSSVGLSFAQPAETIASIATTTLILLEEARVLKSDARIFNTASSECYGQCDVPADESSPFHPCSPYAAARVAAFWTASTYRHAYGMFVATGILANHESPLRPAQFVTTKIIQAVKRILEGGTEHLDLGNVQVQRDWGWAPEFVEAYWRMLQADQPCDYNIATGETNTLCDFVREAFAAADLDWSAHVVIDDRLIRPSEFLATRINPTKIAAELGWRARYRMRDVVRFLLARAVDGALGPLPWQDVA